MSNDCPFPYYGLAPHGLGFNEKGHLMSRADYEKKDWPDNFYPDDPFTGSGWYHCPHKNHCDGCPEKFPAQWSPSESEPVLVKVRGDDGIETAEAGIYSRRRVFGLGKIIDYPMVIKPFVPEKIGCLWKDL